MPYLIDGHNLVPRLGLRLDAPDDELGLIRKLSIFCRGKRRLAEVYFDRAATGHAVTRRFGRVTAHFVRAPRTADDAIRAHLRVLARAAKNWTVVSSDRQVQADAQAARAQVLSSERFAREVRDFLEAGPRPALPENPPDEYDVDEWLQLFSRNRKEHGQL